MAKNELLGGQLGLDMDDDFAGDSEESGPGIIKARYDGDDGPDISTTIHKLRCQLPTQPQNAQSFYVDTPVGAEFRIIRERHKRRKEAEAAAAARLEQEGGRSSSDAALDTALIAKRVSPKKAPRVLTRFEEQVLNVFAEAQELHDSHVAYLYEHPENSLQIREANARAKISLFKRYFEALDDEERTVPNVTKLLRAWLRIHFKHGGIVENLRQCASSLILLHREGRKMDDILNAIQSRAPQAPAIQDSRNLYDMYFATENNNPDADSEYRYIGPDIDAPDPDPEGPEVDLPEYEPPEDL